MARTYKSESQKELTGTAREDRPTATPVEYTAIEKLPPPPPDLSTDMQMVWNTLAGELMRAKILKAVDMMTFEILVRAIGDYRAAVENLDGKPMVVVSKGRPVANPYVKIKQKSAEMIVKLCAHFGFSPLWRTRLLQLEREANEDDPVAALLFGDD